VAIHVADFAPDPENCPVKKTAEIKLLIKIYFRLE